MKRVNLDLCKDTYLQKVIIENVYHDLHFNKGWYYICEKDTFNIVATMMPNIYKSIMEV